MNTRDDLERELGEQLHRQVAGLHDSPLALADVKGRARTIRRNRRLAAGAGVAAALLVVVPTAITAGGALQADRISEPEPLAPPREVVRTTLTLDDLPSGPPPEVEYFTPDGVVLPGEGTRELPYNYNALVPSEADGGWLGWRGASLGVRYLDEELVARREVPAGTFFVGNPDRSAVAWGATRSGEETLVLHPTVDSRGELTWEFPYEVEPVDFLAEDRLVYTTLNQRTGRTEVGVAEPDGSTTPLPGYLGAVSASPEAGLVAVQTRSRNDGSGCFGMVEPATPAEPLWESCDHSLGAFSPDGRYVLASGSYLSGVGIGAVQVLDAATGEEVARFDPARRSQLLLQRLVWESSDSFLAVAGDRGDVTILRFGVDGSLTEVAERLRSADYGDVPYFFGGDRVRRF